MEIALIEGTDMILQIPRIDIFALCGYILHSIMNIYIRYSDIGILASQYMYVLGVALITNKTVNLVRDQCTLGGVTSSIRVARFYATQNKTKKLGWISHPLQYHSCML